MSTTNRMDKNKLTTRSNAASASQPLVTTLPKRSREDLTNSDDDVDSLTELWTRMQSMFSVLNDRITQMEGKIEANIAATKSELSQRMDVLEEHVTSWKKQTFDDVNNLRSEVNTLRDDLFISNEAIERFKKSQQLVISGIPYTHNEDLNKVVEHIASGLGIPPPMVDLRRLAKSPIAVGYKPLILREFALKQRRDAFFSAYLSQRSLTLRTVGFPNDERIFINENLTVHAIKL